MGNVRTLGCALVLFGALVSFASSALGQACVPVVFAFRHAEDTNPPNPPGPTFALTPTGQAHANLYPTMISGFLEQTTSTLCPVVKVYAATTVEKVAPCGNECASASNAFDTAKPLAQAVMSADPITTVPVPTATATPAGAGQLYEYLGNGNIAPPTPSYTTLTATALRTALLATANLGKSSAIFWTSQGLHVLGGAIINATSKVPDKNFGAKVTPPRNAVYIFVANGSAPNIKNFVDTPSPSSLYVQCFNHVEASGKFTSSQFIPPTGTPPTETYYCGYNEQSNLGGKPENKPLNVQSGTIPNDRNKDIKGKICDTTAFLLPDTSGPGIYGACK